MGIAFFVKWTIRSPFIINYIPIIFVFIKVLKTEKIIIKREFFYFLTKFFLNLGVNGNVNGNQNGNCQDFQTNYSSLREFYADQKCSNCSILSKMQKLLLLSSISLVVSLLLKSEFNLLHIKSNRTHILFFLLKKYLEIKKLYYIHFSSLNLHTKMAIKGRFIRGSI